MSSEWISAGTQPLRSADPQRGSSQSGVRLYNERLVLSLVRRDGSLPKAQIAKLTGLSAQTVSVIVRQLEADGLLTRENPRRGKVGQPLVPFSLNPDGAYSIGLKVGRRSADLVLLDFTGKVRDSLHETYPYPSPHRMLKFVDGGMATLTKDMAEGQVARLAGLGIAAPFEMWQWREEVGAPHEIMEAWRGFDIKAEVAKVSGLPVQLCNDATAACAAELVYGKGGQYRDYAYFFIGSFVGGGLVINGHLIAGRTGNAGAFGSLLVPGSGGGLQQLIRSSSIYSLENRLKAGGRDWTVLWRQPMQWMELGDMLHHWIAETAAGLAHAVAAVMAVIDFEAIVVDGAFPPEVRTLIVNGIEERLVHMNLEGLSPITIVEGTIGADARARGGASLPLLANYAIDRELLFKEML